MGSLYCFTLGFFLLTVRAEKEDFQGHNTDQTKGTTVREDLLLKKENTIGHGTEAIPTKNSHQHTAVAAAAQVLGAVLFDIRPTAPYETTQNTNASAVNASQSAGHFVSRNGQNSLNVITDNPSAEQIHTESKVLLISNHENTVFSSTRSESMMNGPSKPDVHFSTDASKASLRLRTMFDNRNQRDTASITLTSADGGPGIPILSASHPRVIDNLAVPHNDSDDKQSRGEDEKGISKLARNLYPFGTTQYVLQSDTAEDSVRGSTVINLCLTCRKDRSEAHTKKSVATPALLPTEALSLDFNQSTMSLLGLAQQSAGEHAEILWKDISHQNVTKHSGFGFGEQLVYNLTTPLSSFNIAVNHSHGNLNNSHIKSFLSDAGTVAFDTLSLAEMSSVTEKDAKKQSRHAYPSETLVTERPIVTAAGLYLSPKALYTVRKPVKKAEQEMLGERVSIGDPQSKLIDLSKNIKNASQSLSTNLKNLFIQNQSLDFSSGSGSDASVITEAPHSSEKAVLPEGSDHNAASHPTTRTRLTEAHSTVTLSSLSRRSTSAVKHPESHPLTEKADSLISALRNQTPAKLSSQTKGPILTLLPKDSAIKFASVTTKTHLTDEQNSQIFNAVDSIAKQPFVDPSGQANETVINETLSPTFTTRKVVASEKLFLSESRQDVDDDVLVLTTTTPSSKAFSERPTMNTHLGSQSKITQGRVFDVSNGNHKAQTHTYTSAKYNKDFVVHDLKPGDKNEQVLTAVAEDEDKEMNKTEDMHGEEMNVIKEALKLQEEDESRKDGKFGGKTEDILTSDKMENGKQEKLNSGEEINQNTNQEWAGIKEHDSSKEEGRRSIEEEDIILRQNKAPRPKQVRGEEGAERKCVTKMNTKKSTTIETESFTKEVTEAGIEETGSEADIKHNRETGSEDMTNVPLRPSTNSKELNRDKGHTVSALSTSHGVIKQLGSTEHRSIHLDENFAQIVEMKNNPFSNIVTRNQRPLHSTVRSQSTKLSRMTYFPKQPYTQIKPHPSAQGAVFTKHDAASSLTTESTEATFPVTSVAKMFPTLTQTLGGRTSKLGDVLKPTFFPHSSTSKAHHALNTLNNTLPLTTPPLAITAEFLRAKPYFTVNSSTLRVSIIYNISDRWHTFKENPILQTTSDRVGHIIPAQIPESSVKDPLISNVIKEARASSSMNPVDPLQMDRDTSTGQPLALSSKAHISIGQSQRHQGQSAPQISQSSSSSFDMTSGQPCSFKLSEQTAHSDALHAPVDDNKQRSVQTLMASMSPKAKNDQFPLGSVSPLLNLMPFGGDSLPGTRSLTGPTQSASEKEIVRANSDAEYANSGQSHAEPLLGRTDETNQTDQTDSVQKMVTLAVNCTNAITKKMAYNKDEKTGLPFIAQTVGRTKHQVSSADEFSSMSKKQVMRTHNENNHNDPLTVDASAKTNNTEKNTLVNNHLSKLEGYNETRAKTVMFTIQTTHKIEQATNEDFVPTANDFSIGIPVLDRNDRTGTTAFVESDSLPEIPNIQANDVPNNAISEKEHHAAKTTEKQHDPSSLRDNVGDNALPVPHINFRSDLKVSNISTKQIADRIMNVTPEFQITTTTTNDFVSLALSASISGLIVSTEAQESALKTRDIVQVVIEKSSQAAHSEDIVQSNSHIEPLSLREPPATPSTSKHTPAGKRKNITETQSVQQPEHDISVQDIEQSHFTPSGMITIARPDPGQGFQTGLLKTLHRAGEAHDISPTMVKREEYLSFEDAKTTTATKSAFEGKHDPHEMTTIVYTLDKADQHSNALSEKTSTSQVILDETASAPPTGILPSEIITKISCRTTGCAKSGEITERAVRTGENDHAALKDVHKTLSGNMAGHRFNAASTPDSKPETGKCGSDCPVPQDASPQASNHDYAVVSPATTKSEHDPSTVDEPMAKNARAVPHGASTETWRALAETDHMGMQGTLEQAQFVVKTAQRQFPRETPAAQKATTTGLTLPEPQETTAQITVKTAERPMLTEKNAKTQLSRGAAEVEIFEEQNATRSTRGVSKGETALRVSGRRLLLPEPESESELPRLKHRRRTSPHLHLSGVTEVSDDLCGSGNYTAEMSLNLGKGVEPGDAVPAVGNLRVVINLKTNNSRINLEVTSCCLSPTIQTDLTNSTCCLFSRLAAEPAGITLLPSALSTSASFTISLFQMINYSVVYLHCDLSICLRNHSDCERQCLQQRSAFPLEGPQAVVTNLRNRISFGPMLKEVKNSTSPEQIDPSELDLVLVVVSLVAGLSLVTVMLLLVWLAYRRRAVWLLQTASPPRACCGCLRPGGDLILP